jgi:hypothetical protein
MKAGRDIHVDGQAIDWYWEIVVHRKLKRWEEFESWLRSDRRHREVFKDLEQGIPGMIRKIINEGLS